MYANRDQSSFDNWLSAVLNTAKGNPDDIVTALKFHTKKSKYGQSSLNLSGGILNTDSSTRPTGYTLEELCRLLFLKRENTEFQSFDEERRILTRRLASIEEENVMAMMKIKELERERNTLFTKIKELEGENDILVNDNDVLASKNSALRLELEIQSRITTANAYQAMMYPMYHGMPQNPMYHPMYHGMQEPLYHGMMQPQHQDFLSSQYTMAQQYEPQSPIISVDDESTQCTSSQTTNPNPHSSSQTVNDKKSAFVPIVYEPSNQQRKRNAEHSCDEYPHKRNININTTNDVFNAIWKLLPINEYHTITGTGIQILTNVQFDRKCTGEYVINAKFTNCDGYSGNLLYSHPDFRIHKENYLKNWTTTFFLMLCIIDAHNSNNTNKFIDVEAIIKTLPQDGIIDGLKKLDDVMTKDWNPYHVVQRKPAVKKIKDTLTGRIHRP